MQGCEMKPGIYYNHLSHQKLNLCKTYLYTLWKYLKNDLLTKNTFMRNVLLL